MRVHKAPRHSDRAHAADMNMSNLPFRRSLHLESKSHFVINDGNSSKKKLCLIFLLNLNSDAHVPYCSSWGGVPYCSSLGLGGQAPPSLPHPAPLTPAPLTAAPHQLPPTAPRRSKPQPRFFFHHMSTWYTAPSYGYSPEVESRAFIATCL